MARTVALWRSQVLKCTCASAVSLAAGFLAAGCGGGNGSTPDPPVSAVQFTEIWSQQFDGGRFNGLTAVQTTRYAGNQSELMNYVLMGAESGSRARVAIRLQVTGGPSGVVLRFMHRSANGPDALVGRTWRYTGDPTVIEFDPNRELPAGVSSEDPIELSIVAGVDRNGDGHLGDTSAQGEALAISDWRIRLVSQLRYNAQLLVLVPAFAAARLNDPYGPSFALNFLDSNGLGRVLGVDPTFVPYATMATKWDQILAQYATTDLSVFDPNLERRPLSHNVGVDFDSNAQGVVGAYLHPKESDIATSIRSSYAFRTFVLQPALEALAATATGAPAVRTVTRKVAAKFDDSKTTDADLFRAFGTAYYSITLSATVSCTATGRRLNGIVLTGELYDIYDWNFDSPPGPPPLEDIFKQLASVQAGFGTLGKAGQVHTVTVDLGANLLDLDGTEFGEPCGQCPSVAGNWSATGPVQRLCDGSLTDLSFRGSGLTQPVTLYQNGCMVSERQNFPAGESFMLRGYAIQESGTLLGPTDIPGAVYSANQWTQTGAVDPGLRRIDFHTTGFASGTVGGAAGTCTFSSNIVFQR